MTDKLILNFTSVFVPKVLTETNKNRIIQNMSVPKDTVKKDSLPAQTLMNCSLLTFDIVIIICQKDTLEKVIDAFRKSLNCMRRIKHVIYVLEDEDFN